MRAFLYVLLIVVGDDTLRKWNIESGKNNERNKIKILLRSLVIKNHWLSANERIRAKAHKIMVLFRLAHAVSFLLPCASMIHTAAGLVNTFFALVALLRVVCQPTHTAK